MPLKMVPSPMFTSAICKLLGHKKRIVTTQFSTSRVLHVTYCRRCPWKESFTYAVKSTHEHLPGF